MPDLSAKHSPEFVTSATALGPNGVSFDPTAPITVQLPAGVLLGGAEILWGQDSVTARNLQPGLSVYGGYFDSDFANLTAVKARVGSKAIVISISPDGANGARCIDIEPGDAVPADGPVFFRNGVHGGSGMGQNDAGMPMIYCSAGNASEVIAEMTRAGIARDEYLLWLAHWIGPHICGPYTCGYPASDGTQYASNAYIDSDAFYAYCFEVAPVTPPVVPPVTRAYPPVRDLKFLGAGSDSVKVSFDAPSGPGNDPAIGWYDIAITLADDPATDLKSYPRYEPKGSNPEVWQGGSLTPNTSYVLSVRALPAHTGAIGSSPWAKVSFTTAR